MSENVVKFRKRKTIKPPRQTPPRLRKLMIIGGVIYAYFSLTLPG